MQIIPTILVQTKTEWQNEIRRLANIFSRVQIDVIDGQFAANTTVSFNDMGDLPEAAKDFHLMVVEPINWVEKCRGKGASLVIGQIEKMSDQKKFIEMVKLGNMKAGLALDLETEVDKLDKSAINLADHILLMSVKAGFSGQLFDERVLAKIKIVRQMVGEGIEISVDGGINETNIRSVVQAGANVVYLGKTILEADDVENKLSELRKAISYV
ncbi:hypothetical protein A2160_00425 [Candidatus Beckwithbacteria bacterium RBG_13_42_9]|uniref:Ribulose-phosphate 3-epimerase n=1 Tax=Candidatus Beckwithbacteria bacterium RBG_13_42_9 TaxID=1797457 RepID=A0A1F5E3X9_9BACT|nr:MAG: hypothetical protein A2160_00425 [Candidatus Beckwithbacteria bacterium RBG_13_42_9]